MLNTFLSFQVDFAVIASQAGATLNNLLSHAQELVGKLRSLQLDQREFVCLKFLVLFSLGELHIFVWTRTCSAIFMLRTHTEHKHFNVYSEKRFIFTFVFANFFMRIYCWLRQSWSESYGITWRIYRRGGGG